MSHLQIPFITELDQHYSPRQSMDSRRQSVVSGHNHIAPSSRSHSHLHLPLFSSLDEHYSPRASIQEERKSYTAANTRAPVHHSHLNLPLISSLDAYYSPRASIDERRPSIPEVSAKPVNTAAASKKQKSSFMTTMQSYPWFSGSH